jgi:hypothetical protein
MTEQRRPAEDRLAELLGRMDANVARLVDDVKTIQATAVTKEMLEARIGPQQRIFWALVTMVILSIAAAILSPIIRPADTMPPKIEFVAPTPTPAR